VIDYTVLMVDARVLTPTSGRHRPEAPRSDYRRPNDLNGTRERIGKPAVRSQRPGPDPTPRDCELANSFTPTGGMRMSTRPGHPGRDLGKTGGEGGGGHPRGKPLTLHSDLTLTLNG